LTWYWLWTSERFNGILLFPEKEAKSVVLLRRILGEARNSAKPTQGVWGRAPRTYLLTWYSLWASERFSLVVLFLFQKKEAKSFVLLRRMLG
jgi:hypothetical protein